MVTAVIEAHRFEVPNCYRHLTRLLVRYASWDLTHVHLVDERTAGCYVGSFPDKVQNARGVRRPLEPVANRPGNSLRSVPGIAPLLSKLLAQQAPRDCRRPICPWRQFRQTTRRVKVRSL